MAQPSSDLGTAWWSKNLDDVDREVARLASICDVHILDAGVIERVLQDDATVCGRSNPLAFKKLREALMLHYSIRTRAVGALGQTKTGVIVNEIVERLRAKFGPSLGTPTQE